MIQIQYILILILILIACFFIFQRATFINTKLENFEGDDLNIHTDGEYNINTQKDTQKDIIE